MNYPKVLFLQSKVLLSVLAGAASFPFQTEMNHNNGAL